MRVNSKLRCEAAFDGSNAGEGLAIFFSQNGDATARFRFLVKAMIGEGVYQVGECYSSPPNATPVPGRQSRMIAGAVCPGATSWTVEVSAIPNTEGILPAETADIVLASSKCCSDMGVNRVGERYRYHSGNNTGILSNFTVLAGMKVTGITALGAAGDGTVVIDSGDSILVPADVSINLAPGSSIRPNGLIELNNVIWVIEYLESA